jgi:hypothetical protein
MNEPLHEVAATKLVKAIVKNGAIGWTAHALAEMAKDDLKTGDVVNVLRGGVITEAAEYENGSWRYRMHTLRIYVVVAFRSEQELAVVTAWRVKR